MGASPAISCAYPGGRFRAGCLPPTSPRLARLVQGGMSCRPRPWPAPSWTRIASTGHYDGSNNQPRPPALAAPMRYVVTYDIADDRRRKDVATLVSGCGPRVHLSVFECDLRARREAAALQSKLRELIDPVEDQVRLYPLDDRTARQMAIIGARTLEERQDFWIVT
jgi:CRISPR-associated protein Cas2